MVEQLSAADESRIMRALEKAAAMTRTGASPDEALTKSAKELGLNPEMTKVACQAFNKSKSVYMLSKLSADRRGESFDLCDPEKVTKGLFDEKQASAPNTSLDNIMKDFTSLGLITKAACVVALQKTASAEQPKCDAQRDFEYKRDMRETLRALDRFDKLHGNMQMCKTAAELSVQVACERLGRTPKAELEKLARVVVNRYGEDGVRFMKVAQAKIGMEFDLKKTASAAAIPAREPYFSVVRSMEALDSYTKAKSDLEGVAREAIKNGMFKQATLGEESLRVPAGIGMGIITSPFVLAKDIIPSEVSKAQEIMTGRGNTDKAISESLDPVMIKKLENLDLEDAWVDMTRDRFIASHPREQVLSVISDVVNILPMLKQPRNKPLLVSMVRKQLSQGGAIDPVEIGQIATTAKTLAQAEKEAATTGALSTAESAATSAFGVPSEGKPPMDLPKVEMESTKSVPSAFQDVLKSVLETPGEKAK